YARLRAARTAPQLSFASHGPETANDLREALGDVGPAGVDPEEFWELGQELGCEVEVRWSGTGEEGCFDVDFGRPIPIPVSSNGNGTTLPRSGAGRAIPWGDYANDPVRGKAIRGLAPALRTFLRGK